MKIVILGYGKMGKEIEKIALERNHLIVLKIDEFNLYDLTPQNLGQADVAIDFSTPDAAYQNIMKCFEAKVPVVCGTTGWMNRLQEVKDLCAARQQTFFYASNFSLGVYVFSTLNKYLAGIMDALSGYEVEIKEVHHIHKLDAPSGTAISLANDLISCYKRKEKWDLNKDSKDTIIGIKAIREDEVPGTHIITWDSPVDQIKISHEAKSRKGLALGAVLAAEFIKDKKGAFSMQDLIKL
jgi:4-hydroxy-tetrahydrodipicolinate reductase